MAKTMAILNDNIVVNLIWCDSERPNEINLIDIGDYPVSIGDTYIDGIFYHDGEPVRSIYDTIDDMQKALEILGVSE